ncbi:MAG: Ig-like domain-containing protein, partial [Anaerolineaceae bacterium]
MKTKNARLVLGMISVVLLISSACQLPFSEREVQPTPGPVVESQIEVAPAAVQQSTENLPPAVTEADPLPGSVVETRQRFTVVFNQPMNQRSVEDSLSISPAVTFNTDWPDDRTLEISLQQALPLDRLITLTFSDKAESAAGVPAGEDLVLEYRTPGPLRLVDAFPTPEQTAVNPRGAIMVTFNQPVAELGEASDPTPAAFQIVPAVEGSGEWLNSSTYVFTPRPGLGGGMEYTLKLNQNLTSRQGAALKLEDTQKAEWTFITALPHVLSVDPDPELGLAIDAAFTVTFSQPMDAESVESHFSILDDAMQPINGKVEWNEDFSVFTFTPADRLGRGRDYQFTLQAGAASLGGSQMGEMVRRYRTVDRLTVVEVMPSLYAPLPIYNGYSSIQLRFNAPLADADYLRLITFEPALLDSYAYKSESNLLTIGGYFQGNHTYQMTLSAELTDRWGQALGREVTYTFTTGQVLPQLSIPLLTYGFQTLFVTPRDQSLSAQVVNLPGVTVKTEPVTPERFIENLTDPDGFSDLSFSQASISWRQALDGEQNWSQETGIYLTNDNQPLETGLYLYQISAPELEYNAWPFLLVVSDINILLKRGENQLMAWAVDLNTGQPVAGMTLDVYTTGAQPAGSCVTDADGLCTLDVPQTMDTLDRILVMHGQPGDADFAIGSDTWRMGVSGYNFGLYSYGLSGMMAYLYTDRPIYRPGQTVYFRVIARQKNDARYTLPDLGEIHVEVNGKVIEETGEVPVIETITVPLSDYGTGWGSFEIPEDSGAGFYALRITELVDSYLGFQVADYRKPEIDLQVAFDRPEADQGEDLTANLTASYYFGAPAANVPVRWTLYSSIDSFDLPYNYQTGNQANLWVMDYWRFGQNAGLGVYTAQGTAQTGPDGSVKISIPYDQIGFEVSGSDLRRLTLEAVIVNESALPVSARTSLLVHPEAFYVGVRPEQWTGKAGQPLGFAVQTTDQQKKAVGQIELTAELKRIRWTNTINPISGYPETTSEYISESSVSLITDADGQARIELTPEEPGTYVLEVTGGNASTQVSVWVGGSGSVSWPAVDNQQLAVQTDKEEYNPGDTARLFIPNPFERAQALITVERGKVMQSEVIEVTESQLEYTLQMDPFYAPNVYVSVTLLKTGQNGVDEFRQGYVRLPVNPRELVLQVQVTAEPPIAEPGDSVVLSLTAADARGNPVQGEFSLSLVDKAVLALAEPNAYDILTTFYTTHQLGVVSGMNLAAYAARQGPLMAGGRGGGGDGMVQSFLRHD